MHSSEKKISIWFTYNVAAFLGLLHFRIHQNSEFLRSCDRSFHILTHQRALHNDTIAISFKYLNIYIIYSLFCKLHTSTAW